MKLSVLTNFVIVLFYIALFFCRILAPEPHLLSYVMHLSTSVIRRDG